MDPSTKALSSRDLELYALCEVSDIDVDPQIFRILLELLRLGVSPFALFQVLQSLAQSSGKAKKPPVAAKPKILLKEFSNTQAIKQTDLIKRHVIDQRKVR